MRQKLNKTKTFETILELSAHFRRSKTSVSIGLGFKVNSKMKVKDKIRDKMSPHTRRITFMFEGICSTI
jgi:hypothetical protein